MAHSRGTPIKPAWAQTLASLTEKVVSTGRESTAEFRARISEFLEIMQKLHYEKVAVFLHGGWITSTLNIVFGVEISRKNIHCGNCATLILEWTGDAWRLVGWINLPEEKTRVRDIRESVIYKRFCLASAEKIRAKIPR